MSYFKSLIFATAINFEVVGKNPNDIANKSARKNDALMNEKMRSLNVGEAGLVANKRFFVLRGVKVTGLKSAWIPIQRILLSANGTVSECLRMKMILFLNCLHYIKILLL